MRVLIRFYEELNDFLPSESRKKDLVRAVEPGVTVKQVVAMYGIPEALVDLVLVNGTPANFSRKLSEGDRLSVYPVFESFDIARVSLLPGRPLRSPRFLAAEHLGKLSKYLRMLGFDSHCQKGDEEQLISTALEDGRTILSKSSRLMQNPRVTHGYRIQNEMPDRQLVEVVRRFDLSDQIRPLSRCLRCNTLLKSIERQNIRRLVNPSIYKTHQNFRICPLCRRIYWNGSHAVRMANWIDKQVFSTEF